MQLGMVGLGRMGSGMTRRLEARGIEMKTYDPKVDSTARSLRALVKQLEPPRHVWVMVPSGRITEETVAKLVDVLERRLQVGPGGLVVDQGPERRPRVGRPIVDARGGAPQLLGGSLELVHERRDVIR